MAIVKKQGIWTDASYPWADQSANGLMGSIMAEIDAWISAISGNASIVANGTLPVKLREPSDSTNGGVRNGFSYEFPDTSIGLDNDGPTWPTLLVQGTETSLSMEVGDKYLDTTANDGFGDMGSDPGHRVSMSISGDTGFDRQVIIFYDATDEQEFFSCGFKLGTGSTENGGFTVFKDTDGHWFFDLKSSCFGYDSVLGFWVGSSGPYDTDPRTVANTDSMKPYTASTGAATGANSRPNFDGQIQGVWYPSNMALYLSSGVNGRPGNYVLINGGTEAVVETGQNSVAVRVPV